MYWRDDVRCQLPRGHPSSHVKRYDGTLILWGDGGLPRRVPVEPGRDDPSDPG